MVIRSASEYQSDIAREMTIQVRPTPGNDIDAEVLKAESIARATPGMGEVRTYSKSESERLLEPWLGGLSLDELPVPRMIAVRVAPGARVDTATLRQALAEKVAGATLDDHRAWIERMRTPKVLADAIRALQIAMSDGVTLHFDIGSDGSFTLDVGMFVSTR